MENNKLWPVNELLEWLSRIETKFVRIQSNDLSVLLAVLKFYNPITKECFPSVTALSKITLKSETRVRDVLKRLVDLNILKVKPRFTKEGDRDSNLYKYFPENLWEVGSKCSLRWATNVGEGGLHMYPLTNNLTNNLTKKTAASLSRSKNKQQIVSNVDNQSTSYKKNNSKAKPLTEAGLKQKELAMKKAGVKRYKTEVGNKCSPLVIEET